MNSACLRSPIPIDRHPPALRTFALYRDKFRWRLRPLPNSDPPNKNGVNVAKRRSKLQILQKRLSCARPSWQTWLLKHLPSLAKILVRQSRVWCSVLTYISGWTNYVLQLLARIPFFAISFLRLWFLGKLWKLTTKNTIILGNFPLRIRTRTCTKKPFLTNVVPSNCYDLLGKKRNNYGKRKK